MGGTQVPLWITVLLGVLAVAGTVGGAWGGQIIAARNEARRWQRERDREGQAFWRDKRLEVYSSVLAKAEGAITGLGIAAGLKVRSVYDDEELPVTLEHARSELRLIEIIGSPATVALTNEVRSRIHGLGSSIRHPSRGQQMVMQDLQPRLDEVRHLVADLREQFRCDLAVS